METKTLLLDLLKNNIIDVTFTKVDGTIRRMNCTLHPSRINVSMTNDNLQKVASRSREDNLIVWDVDVNDWRTIKIANIILPITVVANLNPKLTTPVKHTGPWGYECVIDAYGCLIESISDEVTIKKFLENLVQSIDMEAYGDPILHRFGNDNKKGYTAIQLIETSNITCHFCEEDGNAYFNVFSCKDFDFESVKSEIEYFFEPESMRIRHIERDANPHYTYKAEITNNE